MKSSRCLGFLTLFLVMSFLVACSKETSGNRLANAAAIRFAIDANDSEEELPVYCPCADLTRDSLISFATEEFETSLLMWPSQVDNGCKTRMSDTASFDIGNQDQTTNWQGDSITTSERVRGRLACLRVSETGSPAWFLISASREYRRTEGRNDYEIHQQVKNGYTRESGELRKASKRLVKQVTGRTFFPDASCERLSYTDEVTDSSKTFHAGGTGEILKYRSLNTSDCGGIAGLGSISGTHACSIAVTGMGRADKSDEATYQWGNGRPIHASWTRSHPFLSVVAQHDFTNTVGTDYRGRPVHFVNLDHEYAQQAMDEASWGKCWE